MTQNEAGKSSPAAQAERPNEIVTTRLFSAPRALVWRVWTEPAHVAQWWGPKGFTNTISEMDVRPGGVWTFVMHGPDGTDYPNKIIFREIVAPERLAFSHVLGPKFEVEVFFEEVGEKTRVTMRASFASAAERDKIEKAVGAVEGAQQTFDRLGEHLARRESYRPGAASLQARLQADGERLTLIFIRELKHPPSKVWSALTDPKILREWAPFDAARSLSEVGPTTLFTAGGPSPEPVETTVLTAREPSLLEYDWGGDLLRWELEPTEFGTRLTLHHTTTSGRSWAPKYAAGWHMCLDVAERALDGAPIIRIVAQEAKRFGWERLQSEYAKIFGAEDTGWPEEKS